MLGRIKTLGKANKGFTIIEVMIVLAIAGLIMVIVFLAIPQLQRSQRNTRRKDATNRIKTELDNYSGNNNGKLPAPDKASGKDNLGTPNTALGFFIRYLGCTASAVPAVCTGNIDDPQTGYALGTDNAGSSATATTLAVGTAGTLGAVGAIPGNLAYNTGTVCSGEDAVAGSTRNYTLQVKLEGTAVYCVDNH